MSKYMIFYWDWKIKIPWHQLKEEIFHPQFVFLSSTDFHSIIFEFPEY